MKEIPGLDNYHATEDGRIWSTIQWRGSTCRELTQVTSGGKRYKAVRVRVGDKRMTKNVHRLIALTFLGPPPFDKAQVRHINGDKFNNAASNLAWGTAKENSQDRIIHGVQGREWATVSNQVLSVEEVIEIRDKFDSGTYTQKELASKFDCSPSTINDVGRRRTWKFIP